MKHLVIGNRGEVGSALENILKDSITRNSKIEVTGIDLGDEPLTEEDFDYLHICFPFDFRDKANLFTAKVLNYMENYLKIDGIVIIHSTVYPGTTKFLVKIQKEIVYSPIRGTHPHLFHGLYKYPKFFASYNTDVLDRIRKDFGFVFIDMKFYNDPTALEIAKHTSTKAFGFNLLMGQELAYLSTIIDFDTSVVVDFVNDTGRYLQDRKIYPYIEKIGGHCVIQNAEMIMELSPLAKFLVEKNKDFGNLFKDRKFILKKDTNNDE